MIYTFAVSEVLGSIFLAKCVRRLILREALPWGMVPLLAALLSTLIAFLQASCAFFASLLLMASNANLRLIRVALFTI